MKVAIVYNDSSCKLAESILSLLYELGHDVLEIKNSDPEFDYTDLTICAGWKLLTHHADRTILICESGLCTSITANKMKGLYASTCYDWFEVHISRSKYNTNVLCLSDRWTDNHNARHIVKEWVKTPFQERSNDLRSLSKIEEIQEEQLCSFCSGLKEETVEVR